MTWLVLLANLAAASGKLIGAAVVPHGDFAYDPQLVNDTGRIARCLGIVFWIFAEDEWN